MNLKGTRFENKRLGMEIYVYDINGGEWFIGKDIAKLLEYSDESSTISKKVNNKYKNKIYVKTIENIGNCQNGNSEIIEFNNNLTMINEFGLYQLVCSSKMSEAINFQEWIYEEVLPSIRKNNFYVDENYVSKEQLNDLMEKVKNLIVSKKMLHEITYDMADATTMSFTEASKKLFGKDAKYLKKILIEHGFFDKENNIIIGEAEFKNPKGELEMIRIFTRTNVEKARKEDDIRYCKITNFGYMYLKKYFNTRGLSDFKFSKNNIDIEK